MTLVKLELRVRDWYAPHPLFMSLQIGYLKLEEICRNANSIINETITNITTQYQLMEIIMLSTNTGNNKITEHKGSGLKRKA
jgi:hypothetical protein